MNPTNFLAYPLCLTEGRAYTLLEKGRYGPGISRSVVTFVGYTACPAVVIVQNGASVRRRCPRECLLEAPALANEVREAT